LIKDSQPYGKKFRKP